MIAKINLNKKHQQIEGFGAAFPSLWGAAKLVEHPYFDEICDWFFKEGGMTFLRMQNCFDYREVENFKYHAGLDAAVYTAASRRAKERNEEVKVLLSSWTPPHYLKSDDRETNGDCKNATLKKHPDGTYMYEELGEYWAKLVTSYKEMGLPIDYASIQNEGDFDVDYIGCLLSAKEGEFACYAKAYLAVYNAIKLLPDAPLMVGPETMSTSSYLISDYMKEVFEKAPESVHAIASHYYTGDDVTVDYGKNYVVPSSYRENLERLNECFPSIGKFQTEFFLGSMLDTAEMIFNCLAYGNGTAYMYWDGVWYQDGGGLIDIEHPKKQVQWTTEHGYKPKRNYYAMRHFSENIRPGDTRIDVVTEKEDVQAAAFLSPNQDRVTIVMINRKEYDTEVELHFESDASYVSKKIICSKEDAAVEELYQSYEVSESENRVVIPAKSVITWVLSK